MKKKKKNLFDLWIFNRTQNDDQPTFKCPPKAKWCPCACCGVFSTFIIAILKISTSHVWLVATSSLVDIRGSLFSTSNIRCVFCKGMCDQISPEDIFLSPPAHLPTGINIRNGMVDILFYRPTHKEGSCLRIITRQTHIWRHWRKQKIKKVSFKGRNRHKRRNN